MMRMSMSRAASGLLRALLARADAPHAAVRLASYHSNEWRALTMEGEQHEFVLSLTADQPGATASRLLDGLSEHEFELPSLIVADILGSSSPASDGPIEVRIEALTVAA